MIKSRTLFTAITFTLLAVFVCPDFVFSANVRIPTGQECSKYIFTKKLYQKITDTDVLCLQILLNSDPDTKIASTGYGSAGYETIYFGLKTKLAVIKFQKKYSISPLGLVGPITRTKLNSLLAAAPLTKGLTVSLPTDNPKTGNIVKDQLVVPLLKISLSNGDATAVKITSLKIKASKASILSRVYLYNGVNRLQITPTVSNNVIDFENSVGLFQLQPNSSVEAGIYADVSGNTGDTISVSIDESISITTNASSLNATFPLSGNIMTLGDAQQQGVFTITSSAGPGGTIYQSGTVSAPSGSSQTFTIYANSGYSISSVLVDSASVGAVSTYTFSNITANHTISVTFAREQVIQATKNIYNYLEMKGDNGEQPWNFISILGQRYTFLKKTKILFLNDHTIDTHYDDPNYLQFDASGWDRIQQILTNKDPNYGVIDPGTYIVVDLEIENYYPQEGKWSDFSYHLMPGQPGWIMTDTINARANIITRLKAIRPDCYFGYYAVPITNGFSKTLNPSGYALTDALLDEMEIAQKPTIDASDFLVPNFYWAHNPNFNNSPDPNYTAANMVSWVQKVIERTKKYYPDKKIIPIIWPLYYADMTPEMNQYTYQWTPDQVTNFTVSGPDWRQLLNALSAAGVSDIFAYNDGNALPWSNTAPWWLQTLDWAGQSSQPVSLNNIQGQLASLFAALQNLINSLKR